MPLTGLFLVPLTPTSNSPTAPLLSHITLNFPCSPLPTFSVSFQLFASTSSLLPDSQSKIPRQYCQLLTTSHNGEITHVGITSLRAGATASSTAGASHITIPASSAEAFAQLLNTKLQPLWAHRQSLTVENGTSISLQDGEYTFRVGDLKQTARVAGAPATLRGVLVEVTFVEEHGQVGESGTEADDAMLKAFLQRLVEGSGIKLDEPRLISRHTEAADQAEGPPAEHEKTSNEALAGLYMDLLRGPRS